MHTVTLRPQPLAQALVAMLERAEPPICVGLYARWGAGKTFMISLLKEEFDKTVREEPQTRKLLQFFEEGYAELEPKNGPADDPKSDNSPTVGSFIPGLLRTILFSFISGHVPYGVTTFASIVFDAFYISEASHKAWKWCSKLQRSCKPKAKTAESGTGRQSTSFCDGNGCMAGLYNKLSGVEDQEQVEKETIKMEFIFVNFNAWECAACLSPGGQD